LFTVGAKIFRGLTENSNTCIGLFGQTREFLGNRELLGKAASR